MILTKVICFLFTLFILVLANEIPPEVEEIIMPYTKECREEYNVTEAEMKAMMKGKIPGTPSAECIKTCLLKEFKIVEEKEDGKLELKVDTVVTFATQIWGLNEANATILREISENCKSFKIENPCLFSAELGKCFENQVITRGIAWNGY